MRGIQEGLGWTKRAWRGPRVLGVGVLSLESRIGVEIPSDHDVIPWIIEYSATIINKGQVGADGKTAYERLKGKSAKVMVPFVTFRKMCYAGAGKGVTDTGLWKLLDRLNTPDLNVVIDEVHTIYTPENDRLPVAVAKLRERF